MRKRLTATEIDKVLVDETKESVGLSPGALIYIGQLRAEKPRIRTIEYNRKMLRARDVKDVEDIRLNSKVITWVRIEGIHDTGFIGRVGKKFGLHPLIMEDVVNTELPPKFEDLGKYAFVVLKRLYHDEVQKDIKAEHVSIALGKNFIISFQETRENFFGPVAKRLSNVNGRMRKMGPDYLLYALIDVVVDNYILSLEKLREKLEKVDKEVINRPNTRTLQDLHELKTQNTYLRRMIRPLREVVGALERRRTFLVSEDAVIFFRDIYEHLTQVIDSLDLSRELLGSMTEVYMESLNNKMNQVMKILTVISTVFLPLNFIAGIYGMNIEGLPGSTGHWGFSAIFGFMLLAAAMMLWYFRKKKWF